ncbi:trans-sulfuration enzyme family protein [Sandaracinus amylolyticus]|uniref:Cystathionine gamma-lyase n=1 Tax=Sandaracinus amylolyticus TaxID=927083 RepID=A0A0F6W5T4_9BACT|nr:aminotransferase class I/II-fold pyridoxal phosphate-dependent enzyme [Sandaracinus amylolyticus]AKF08237.1 Cystathionine gamma-lyase [Sandaracinus amylolyticus]
MTDRTLRPGTLAVHAGEEPDPTTGALEPPIVLASAYAFASADDAAAQFRGEQDGWIYGRWRNPTVESFERKIAALEGAEATVALASGMAAVNGAIASCARAGEHVVAPRSVYAEAARLMREVLPRFGVETTFVDQTDLAAVEAAMTERTRIVYAETPANPNLVCTDLAALAELAHARGAVLIVDGTFATPWHQRPLALGADLVLHSATKAICGHGDAIGGVVSGSRDRVTEVRRIGVRAMGGAMAPNTAAMLARGVRTLGLRMDRASASAMELARRLEEDRRVARVWYPGLPSHPQHAIARAQMTRGFGAMIAFEVAGGLEAGKRCHDAVEVIARAVSLGDVRSLLTHPATTTQASMPREARIAAGVTDGLMRFSVGIEDVEDLWEDLDRALPSS